MPQSTSQDGNVQQALAGVGLAADIAQYASKYQPDNMEDKKPLAMVMSLDSRYFPEELYTSKERK